MKRVFICSPYRGNVRRNRRIAEELCRIVINEGDAPYAPHLYLTDVLDDNKPEERENGIACGLEFLKQCDEILAYAPNNSLEKDVTPGMFRELSFAVGLGIPRRKYMKPIELKFPYKIAGYWLAKREAEKSC